MTTPFKYTLSISFLVRSKIKTWSLTFSVIDFLSWFPSLFTQTNVSFQNRTTLLSLFLVMFHIGRWIWRRLFFLDICCCCLRTEGDNDGENEWIWVWFLVFVVAVVRIYLRWLGLICCVVAEYMNGWFDFDFLLIIIDFFLCLICWDDWFIWVYLV